MCHTLPGTSLALSPTDSSIKTYNMNAELASLRGKDLGAQGPLARHELLMKKWREERNFWVTFFAFTMWW